MAFADFSEQQQVVTMLQRSLERQRLGHSYLFIGANLAELEAAAATLGKTLNCESPKRGVTGHPIDCCDRCDSCHRINEKNHPDVFWMQPESKSRVILIDQIRDLMQSVNLKARMAQFKVGIISSADRLNPNAANAFLKTLEEPPARSVFILLTTEPQRILETILSRCLRLTFVGERKLREDESAWLSAFAETAANTQGGLLGRYRILGALAKRLATLRGQIDESLSARSLLQRYDDLDPKMRDKLEVELKAAIESEYRRQRSDLLLAVQLWLRDVWLRTIPVGEELLSFTALTPLTNATAKRISPRDAMENLQVMEQTQHLLVTTNMQEALTLEVGFLKLKL